MRKNIILKFENEFDGYTICLFNDADSEGAAERKGPFFVTQENADGSVTSSIKFDAWADAHREFKNMILAESDMVLAEFG
jgi:hypothetical protein